MSVQREYTRPGSLKEIGSILSSEKPTSIFFVRGKKSYYGCGAAQVLEPFFREYKVTEFTDFSSNPQWEDVVLGIEKWRMAQPSLVVAIGGGSSIDVAKAITILAEQSNDAEEYLQQKILLQPRKTTFLAIPTTSGTGSEATHFATAYKDKEKYSLAHMSLIPDLVILDPSLTLSLSPYVTACTGMDALAQGIESYWSTQSTEESKTYAREAITLALQHLETAVHHPENLIARTGMMNASHLAGKAINISKTTACHAISYPMTSYFNIPHGHAVALTLGGMIEYNAHLNSKDCNDQRGQSYVMTTMQQLCEMLNTTTAEDARERINRLMDSIGLKRKMIDLGIKTTGDISTIIKHGFHPERVGNNPRQITEESLLQMLQAIQ